MKKKQQHITDCGGIPPVPIPAHDATATHTPKEENKMKKQNENLTELVFILDRSGSMHGLEADTIGGFNSMLEKQKRLEGEALVTTVLFDDEVELLHDRLPLSRVKPLTREDYTVRGCTALLDTVGDTVSRIGTVHKYARAEDRPAHTVFVITTDGMENASRRTPPSRCAALSTASRSVTAGNLFSWAPISMPFTPQQASASAQTAPPTTTQMPRARRSILKRWPAP